MVILACLCFTIILIDPYQWQGSNTDSRVSADFLNNRAEDNTATVYFYKNDIRDLKHRSLILYVWKDGDSITSLAQSYMMDPKHIMRLNGIHSDEELYNGRIIFISHVPGVILIVRDHPLSLAQIARDYDLDLSTLMRNNKQSDPDYQYVPGEPILIPAITRDQGQAMGLIGDDKKTIITFVARTSSTWSPQFTAESSDILSNNPRILKTRVYRFKENNGMSPWFCTYYVAHRALWAFPKINETTRFRWLQGNAIAWYNDAVRKWFKVSKTPSAGAIVVYGRWTGWYGYAGHVAYVESVNRNDKTMIVSDMNYAWLWTATTRIVNMNDTMTKSTSDRQVIIGFIPQQTLPQGLHEQYQKAVNAIFVAKDTSL